MSVLEAARSAAADLGAASAPTALIGGLAVSFRAEPRNTRDVDFAVAVAGDAQAEAIVRDLSARGYGLVTALEHNVTGRLATVRLRPARTPTTIVDLLFASSGIEPEIVAAAEAVELAPDFILPVARTGHLIAMKLLARDDKARPQDRVDLAALLLAASEDEIERARSACALIAVRGYARGRDLDEELRKVLDARPTPR
jgi:predicted nucleotidyltransferase